MNATMDVEHLQLAEDKEFLGEEFLTWLWHQSETEGGEIPLEGGRRVGVVLDDYLNLVPIDEDSPGEHTLRRGAPGRSAEALLALQNGKRVNRARLVVGTPDGTWAFTFDARTFDFQSVKVPDGEALHPDDRLIEKLGYLEDLPEILDELYALFLSARLSPAWERKVLPAVRSWLCGGGL